MGHKLVDVKASHQKPTASLLLKRNLILSNWV